MMGTQNGDSGDPLHTFERHVQHVPSVTQGIGSLEQDHLEIVIVKRSAAGDLQVATVIADAADQGEPTLVSPVLHSYFKLLHGFEKGCRSSRPVGQLSGGVLKTCADFVHDVRIQPRTCHQQKVARTEATRDLAESYWTGFEAGQRAGGWFRS